VARRRSGRVGLFFWGLLRFPALVILLYLFRDSVLSAIEGAFDIIGITEYTIALVSTAVTRGVIFLSLTLVLWAFWTLIEKLFGPLIAYFSIVAATCVLLFVAFRFAGTRRLYAVPAVLILATNLIPDQIVERFRRFGGLWNWFMAVCVGVAEVFLFRRYVEWLQSLIGGEAMPRRASVSILSVLPGLLLTSGVVAVVLEFEPLVPLEQMIRRSPEVTIIDSGDFNWIDIDTSGRYLYASGHGLQHLQRYDLARLSAPPLLSDSPSGRAQGFAYDSDTGEIYVYNGQTEHLLYFDAATLALKRSLPLPGVSPGDPWVAVDRQSDTITVVSEADIRAGMPFIIVNRSTGAILDRRDFDAGNFLVHPDKPILYLSFFRYRTSLIAYDLEQRRTLYEVSTDSRVDRMAYWKQANEVLLASPVESEVTRFDADTLELKGSLRTIFGVRVLAVDPVRNFLLCGSLATGTVAVFDLETGQERASFYLGPWLRTITLDPDGGIAYVSANGALYRLNYGNIR
jgi:DNA-binding beta-propeller fold protein YncE